MIDAVMNAAVYAAIAVVVLIFWGALGAVAIAVAVELFFL